MTSATPAAVPVDLALAGRVHRHARQVVSCGRTVAGRYPLLFDAALVLLVGVLSVVPDLLEPHGRGPAWLFDLVLVAPLLVRRRWPALVFGAVSAVALVQWAVGTQSQGDLAVLVALYTVGAYEARRRLIALAAVVAEVGVVLATARWAPPGHAWAAALLLTGTVTAAWVVGVYVRMRRAYLAAVLDRAVTAERDRDTQSQLAVADERARIAREMHDIVAHSLSVMIALNDGAAASALTDPQETRLTSQQAAAVGRQSMAEMRRLLGVLRIGEHPGRAPQPDSGGLEVLVGQVRAAGLPVELTVSGRPDAPPAGAQLAVHRIVQESLTNVLRHAPAAARTVVRLSYRPDRVDVEVTNDDPAPRGTAAPPPDRTDGRAGSGHGLAGMRERAAVYGGQVRAGRGTDGSWRVSTRLHLDPSADPSAGPASDPSADPARASADPA